MKLVRIFETINKSDAAFAGGKGASLGELTQAGIPVPPGFVILAEAFERFLDTADLNPEIDSILHTVNRDEMHTVEHASEKIQRLILDAKMPEDIAREIASQFRALGTELVAVRSSATAEDSASAAWAGQLDTFLNTTEDKLLENVQRCWASLFTPRAIFYRLEKDLHDTKISVAVVVQKMVQSEVSGIAFSVHPVTEDRNQMIIEAGFGLGEAIVSGQVTPDSYVVEKELRRIIDINLSAKSRGLYRSESQANEWREIAEPRASSQALSNEQILELAKIVIRIENHYGFPCDIEWAFEKGEFYITQSRPITTLRGDEVSRKCIFEKTIERDSTFFMQGLFAIVLTGENYLDFGKGNRYRPIIVSHFTGENMQVWENHAAVGWFLDQLLEKNRTDDEFLAGSIKNQQSLLPALKEFWKSGDLFTPELRSRYYDLAMRSMINVTICYYSGMDERTPEKIKEIAVEGRKDDEFFAHGDEFIRVAFAKQGYSEIDAALITPYEFANPPSVDALRGRGSGCVLVDGDSLFEQSLQDYAYSHVDSEFKNLTESISVSDVVHGNIAYKGIVRGRVRIVKNRRQMETVEEGNIMVSPMTTPDFLPAMQKAAAFVTDEGGIVCHAAIVAREMKKPCIIGTRFATQILKDGDMVEVDANTGVVKILR